MGSSVVDVFSAMAIDDALCDVNDGLAGRDVVATDDLPKVGFDTLDGCSTVAVGVRTDRGARSGPVGDDAFHVAHPATVALETLRGDVSFGGAA